jgi:hypothetical protein
MPASPRRLTLVLLATFISSVACKDTAKQPATESVATPAPQLAPFQQEIASQKAEVTLPGSWRYGYHLVDKPDTTQGAFQAIEFQYGGDSATNVPARLLLAIHVFKKEAWEKIASRQTGVSTKLAEHGGNVYSFSIVTRNPYALNTPAFVRVEAMMIALTAKDSPFKIEFK